MVTHACHSSIREDKAKGLRIQGQSSVPSDLKTAKTRMMRRDFKLYLNSLNLDCGKKQQPEVS